MLSKFKRIIAMHGMTVALTISILIHLLLLIWLNNGRGNESESRSDKQPSQIDVNIITKDPELTKLKNEKIDLTQATKSKTTEFKKEKTKKPKIKKKLAEKKKKGEDCEKNGWYGGIGITTNYELEKGGEIIKEVFRGYPAHRNGLRVGDVILYPNADNIRGNPGTEIVMRILRGTKHLTLKFKRDKICYSNKAKNP